jgi:hypothetical protein
MHYSDGSSSNSSNLERSEIVPLINLLPSSDAIVLSSGVDLPLLTSLDGNDSSASGTSRHNFRKEIPVFGGQETKWIRVVGDAGDSSGNRIQILWSYSRSADSYVGAVIMLRDFGIP